MDHQRILLIGVETAETRKASTKIERRAGILAEKTEGLYEGYSCNKEDGIHPYFDHASNRNDTSIKWQLFLRFGWTLRICLNLCPDLHFSLHFGCLI